MTTRITYYCMFSTNCYFSFHFSLSFSLFPFIHSSRLLCVACNSICFVFVFFRLFCELFQLDPCDCLNVQRNRCPTSYPYVCVRADGPTNKIKRQNTNKYVAHHKFHIRDFLFQLLWFCDVCT